MCKYLSLVVTGKGVALMSKGMNPFKYLVENPQKEREIYMTRSGTSITMKHIFDK